MKNFFTQAYNSYMRAHMFTSICKICWKRPCRYINAIPRNVFLLGQRITQKKRRVRKKESCRWLVPISPVVRQGLSVFV